jgi:hypothetical protein
VQALPPRRLTILWVEVTASGISIRKAVKPTAMNSRFITSFQIAAPSKY